MQEPSARPVPPRLASLDAYRGFVMLAMASGGLGLAKVAGHFPDSPTWQGVASQVEHVLWRGCSAWDLIQPSFMFMVGAAMPFSYEARRARGESWRAMFGHAVARSFILVALAIFLTSAWSPRTDFLFTNVLAQIGLGYTFVFLLLGRPPAVQLAAAMAILVADWALFAAYPMPDPATAEWLPRSYEVGTYWTGGLLSHWSKHRNVAAAFDHWFLNLFPRPDGKPYTVNEGGYSTLNFVPSIATMLFGVLAGEWLRSPRDGKTKCVGLALAGALCMAAGTMLDPSICPVVKRLWTPSWAIYSTAWTCWMLAGFYAVIDVAGWRRWAFPMVVVGVNSIAMYVMAQLMKGWVRGQVQIHGRTVAAWLGLAADSTPDAKLFAGPYGPFYESAAVLFVLWLICFGMYRRRIFLKI